MEITRQTLIGILVVSSSILPLILTNWIIEEQIAAGYPWWTTASTVAVGVLTSLILLAGGILAIVLERKRLKARSAR
ncbi:hypothetical protein EU537_00305 [Candidatus Thorarchaeota archaeon]|nr:MAG: hypothetical protein EU537_00305 [Candidatus Thorarchaeota archaeon]